MSQFLHGRTTSHHNTKASSPPPAPDTTVSLQAGIMAIPTLYHETTSPADSTPSDNRGTTSRRHVRNASDVIQNSDTDCKVQRRSSGGYIENSTAPRTFASGKIEMPPTDEVSKVDHPPTQNYTYTTATGPPVTKRQVSIMSNSSTDEDDEVLLDMYRFGLAQITEATLARNWAKVEEYTQTILTTLGGKTEALGSCQVPDIAWANAREENITTVERHGELMLQSLNLILLRAQIKQEMWFAALSTMQSICKFPSDNLGGLVEYLCATIYFSLDDLRHAEQYCQKSIKIGRTVDPLKSGLREFLRLMVKIMAKSNQTMKADYYQSRLLEDTRNRVAALNLSLGSNNTTIIGTEANLRSAVEWVIKNNDSRMAEILFEGLSVFANAKVHWDGRANSLLDKLMHNLTIPYGPPHKRIRCRPLHMAVGTSAEPVVRVLLEKGADVNDKDNRGRAPLSYAHHSKNGDTYTKMMILRLLSKGANINEQSEYGLTALHYAAFRGNLPVVAILLEYGANMEERNSDGSSVLHWACMGKNAEIVSMLLNRGAKVDSKNNEGSTPLHFASRGENTEVVQLLLKAGADVNGRDISGYTALHFATIAYESNLSPTLNLVSLLLTQGANKNSLDNDGHIPRNYVNERSPQLLKLLT